MRVDGGDEGDERKRAGVNFELRAGASEKEVAFHEAARTRGNAGRTSVKQSRSGNSDLMDARI